MTGVVPSGLMAYHAPMRRTIAYGLGYGFGLGLARLGSAIADLARRALHL